ncbi:MULTISPECIES: hypothetical protein [unclassified Lentimicrobium]|uniref:hypothetical protein n=1 Tax=unclassified Lentimicrobium TaxID=2677434 RepID=UPI001555844E|nr:MULTISPECIES: hypothetical protein [unclassified Lentimicrobium]NPD45786.1 hypothetical protein [Lentimicrobium sp. S6]NPD84801.1 hypothetical protein [Lentimicrobium sp. L6]
MSDKYKIHESDKAYFITMTTVGWVDIFTRKNHKMAMVDSLKYCIENKGLEIYGWVLMHSHLHLMPMNLGDNIIWFEMGDYN